MDVYFSPEVETPVIAGGPRTLANFATHRHAIGSVAPESVDLQLDITCQQGQWIPFVKSVRIEIGMTVRDGAPGYARYTASALNPSFFCAQAESLSGKQITDSTYRGPEWYTPEGAKAHEMHHVSGYTQRARSWVEVMNRNIRKDFATQTSASSSEQVLERVRQAYDNATLTRLFDSYSAVSGGVAEGGGGLGFGGSAYRAEGDTNRPFIAEICRAARAGSWGFCRVCE